MADREVFISYSHRDVEWRRRLDSHLKIFRFLHTDTNDNPTVGLRYWSDEDISTGAFWEREIDQAIDRASAALLLISADFLSSDFIMKREVRLIREKKASNNLAILPFVIRPCAWDAFDWISELNLFRQGEPLSTLSPSDQDARMTELFREIERYLAQPLEEAVEGEEGEEEPDIPVPPTPPIDFGLRRESPVQADVGPQGPMPAPAGGDEFRFMDKAGLADYLAERGHAPMLGAVQIFDIFTQHTWIAVTPQRVICVLDSEKTFRKGRLIQWTMPTIPVPRVRARRSGKRKLSGLVDIGGRQNWLFSLRLFEDDPKRLEADLNALLSMAVGKSSGPG